MADAKITALTAIDTIALADLLPIVDDVAGTPVTKKATVEQLQVAMRIGEAVVRVADYATGGTGTSGDPWTGWDTAITWSANTRYIYRSGYFAHDGSTNFLKQEIQHIGEGTPIIKHTGRGYAFKLDADTIWIFGARIEGLLVEGAYSTGTGTASPVDGETTLTGTGTDWGTSVEVGDTITFWTDDFSDVETRIVTAVNSDTSLTVDIAWTTSRTNQSFRIGTSTYGFWCNGLRSCAMVNCSAKDVGHAAFYQQACVCNLHDNLRSYYYSPPVGIFVRPKYGLHMKGRSGAYTTASTYDNLVIESTRDIGIYIETGCYDNMFSSGTSEANLGQALVVAGERNGFYHLSCEANLQDSTLTGEDILVSGQYNVFIGCVNDNAVVGEGFYRVTGDFNRFNSCYGTVDIDGSGALSNVVEDLTGTLTNTGTDTKYRNISVAHPYDSNLGICRPVAAAAGSSSGTIDFDARDYNSLQLQLSGNVTLANPTNLTSGQRVTYQILNPTGGALTVSYGSYFVGVAGQTLPETIPVNAAWIISGQWFAGPNRIYVDTYPALVTTGGAMTGPLTGTTATFSGAVKGSAIAVGTNDYGTNLDIRAATSTAYAAGIAFNAASLAVTNTDTTADSYCQVLFVCRTSGVAYGKVAVIQKGASNADMAINVQGVDYVYIDSSAGEIALNGTVKFGTHSAVAAETVTGYITIKDSAGNSRKLAVLS